LMLVHSDNGGPTYAIPGIGYGGANNLPLRGGKMSDWEGGIRVNAFISGGAVPTKKRGSVVDDYIHECDWYATFCKIAGVDVFDKKAHAANLAPVDGIDHSALIFGSGLPGTGARTEIHHSVRALTVGKWKLITGGLMDELEKAPMGGSWVPLSGWRTGWGADARRNMLDFVYCGRGCLFDVQNDPFERNDTSSSHQDVVQKMKARLDELNKGVMQRDVGEVDPAACTRWDGFYGPWVDLPPLKDSVPEAALPFSANKELAKVFV